MLKIEHGFVQPNGAVHALEHMQLVALRVDLDCAESRRFALKQIVDQKRGHRGTAVLGMLGLLELLALADGM